VPLGGPSRLAWCYMGKMCKHNKKFKIIEFGIEDLHHIYDEGDITRGMMPGNIESMAEFECLICGYQVRFNKTKPKFQYLKNALNKIGI